ncbi:alpha/beta hydrolase [Sporohalobacter salinus]|uniref:alpha/beta hydrolase n=1 Tax=Sporohalobacter salinus TaxID=1494606 RepID=UPI0019607AF2|nr:alpha/beta hydrolase [Sporohalobacter salinus]MBM7623663.1 pimeloyl-ACP methyl ester carboxylesterase [Sporohalobacter salinus]
MKNLRKYGESPFRVAVIHGGPGAPGEMAPVAKKLSFEVGILEPLQTETSIEEQVEELKTVLEKHGEIPVMLIGYSWGTWLSFIFAANYPSLVKKIILVGSGPFKEKYAFDNKKLYNKTNCRQKRIQDIEFVVKYVLDNIYNNNLENVVLLGGSEGGVIVPEIASDLEEITHMVVMGAGGYSQARELEILLEQEISSEEEGLFEKVGIRNEEDLQNKFDEIRNNPSPDKFWFGGNYKRWNSYLDYSPEEYITSLDIPVLFIIGKEDKMVPYQPVEYLAKKLGNKDNFRFEILPGLNHSFTDKDGNNKINYIIEQIILPWYHENGI